MNDFLELIKERRSIRNYQEKDVSDEILNVILEAVQWTPSWANTQCWEVIVVKDQSIKLKLQEAVPKINPAFKSVAKAPVLLALCAKQGTSGFYKGEVTTKFGEWSMFDLGLAAQSMCLAAQACGLGTLIIGLYDHDKARVVINAPDNVELIALITVGYSSKIPPAPKRKEIKEFIHYNTF